MKDRQRTDTAHNWLACRSVLERGLGYWNIRLSTDKWRQCEIFFKELMDWNKTTNLTAITNPSDFAIKHFLDSIAPLHYGEIFRFSRVLDLGTGGGFPGIPLKILRPDMELTLIEKSEKKASFLHTIIGKLGLSPVSVITERIENLQKSNLSKNFETVLARALANPQKVIEWALQFVSPTGKIAIYSSSHQSPTLDLPSDLRRETLEFQLPLTDIRRSLLVISKL